MLILKNRLRVRNVSQAVLALVFVCIMFPSLAQVRINSPYSMFGPGEVKGNDYFRNMSMGGISQGFRSNVSVNYLNPASYTAIDSLSFVFEGTVFSHIYQQQYNNQSQTSSYSAMGNLNFAFPVTPRLRMAAGLMPYSQIGYKISESQQLDGVTHYLYEGSGGINKVYLGAGVKLFGGLSAGINASYLFGRSEDLLVASSDSIGFFRTFWSFSDDIDGLMLTYGLQWEQDLANDRKLTLGVSYTGETSLQMSRNRVIFRDMPGVWGVDTLSNVKGEEGKMVIPANMGMGAFMRFNNRWAGGLDFNTQNWSQFSTYGQQHNLNNAWQVRAGAVHNPRIQTYSGFLSRLEYRAGFRYGQSFLNVNDNTFSEFGISFGVAVPVRRSLSALNLGFEYANRSAADSNLVSENFFKFNIGVNIYERWFMRRRFF